MKKNFKHVLLGTFIDESLKCAKLDNDSLMQRNRYGESQL